MFQGRDKPDSLFASLRGYDSICPSPSRTEATETSPLFAFEHHSSDDDHTHVAMTVGQQLRRDSDVLLPLRRDKTCSRVGILFATVLILGILFWLGTYTYALTERVNDDIFDLDDDYPYETSFLPLPLLGLSAHKAQQTADRARDELASDRTEGVNVDQKDANEQLLGSSGHGLETGCEGTVILMRHCEKGDIREHCSYVGYERSVYLASLFGDDPTDRWPAPSYIFAETPGKRRNPKKKNFRELETVLPLADKFKLKVDTTYSSLDTTKLARRIHGLFRTGEMCGKVLVISWKHSKMARIANALGCARNEGCPNRYRGSVFDELWQLKFVYSKPLHSERKSLKPPKETRWLVFGSLRQEGFDPLAFSKQVGDYPQGGTSKGARWRTLDNEVPERPVIKKRKKKKKPKKKKKHL